VPPLELLYIASSVIKTFGNRYHLKILDTGIGNLSLTEIEEALEVFSPGIVCLNALVWEANLVHKIAALSKKANKDTIILIQGELASLAKEYLLQDENIDCAIIGEGEITVVEFLKAIEKNEDFSKINGIIYRKNKNIVSTSPRAYIGDLDDFSISFSAWDLIDIKEYARYSNWNGSLKERFYIPILTSRGCPFHCTFCAVRDVFGKGFRARSPENVLAEIKSLHRNYQVKEIHIFDAVFNYDKKRAKKICQLIIASGMNLSLAFPHGIRADIMDEELINLLKEAGTYKLTYGIETATPRLQRMIKKNLKINEAGDIIKKTAQAGIIVAGYFMLGFPTETAYEMMQTINFAVNSDLDLAYFFKMTLYSDVITVYQSQLEAKRGKTEFLYRFEDIGYYSKKRSYAEISPSELNGLILKAQQKFYLNLKRIIRGFFRFPHRILFLRNLLNASGLILQSYLIRQLPDSPSARPSIK